MIFFVGMVLSGFRVYNSEQLEHGEQAVSFLALVPLATLLLAVISKVPLQ